MCVETVRVSGENTFPTMYGLLVATASSMFGYTIHHTSEHRLFHGILHRL